MLRITTDENAKRLTLRLEGRLEGQWVAILSECWANTLSHLRGRMLCVDLNGVTFVDAAGKARLAEMHAQGATLQGEDIETKAIVAEICGRGAGRNGDGEPTEIVSLSEQLTNLQKLQDELHAVNEELSKAARPLDRISELSEQQREQVADELRAGFARWDSVTQRIARVLGIDGAKAQAATTRNEGGSR